MLVRVPATTANLGPGFDTFGIAWRLYNEIEFLPGGDELVITGCAEEFRSSDNLAYLGYRSALAAAGRGEEGLTIRFARTDIPIARGLGSSSSLIVGGILAANELHRLGLSRREMLSAATAIEGHPDNVAPALLGGLTVSTLDGGRVLSASFPLSGRLRFTALIPDFELATPLARSVLPTSIPRADAVFNISRAALLLKAFETGDEELLPAALEDRLHQPYRASLIDHYAEAKAAAAGCGALGFCISGAGSTLLCVSADDGFTARMAAALAPVCPAWRVVPLLPDFLGAQCL